MADGQLRIGALYPNEMNIYADRGNIAVLTARCRWRGIEATVTALGLGDEIDSDAFDLFYLGGGQDDDQRRCAEDLVAVKKEALTAASQRGAVLLGVCGGYQLFGHWYELEDERIEGLGLLDVETVRAPGARLIGNIAIELDGGDGDPGGILAGFENHGGRTLLRPGATPLGRVLKGHGNDGSSGFEGCRSAHTIGTYLHGPLLPANAWFADWLIQMAVGEAQSLPQLDDDLEELAHADALKAAGL
ncbi:MAG: glutamine amidotransferase [Actinobacteria bacterium]|uniref:Unannotated protein n=1 Tax=freshwater metagenome TaxID=449393 RepID=A0A6J5ZPA6_9ZZZZ|nr:glutamine amidotransferase [Actinomycetota bacterium]